MLHWFYHGAFDARAEKSNEIIANGQAIGEGYVVGKHIGEFAGIPATGKEFRVPLCVVYDVEDDQIKRARIYFKMPALLAQLGIQMGPD
jgi:predicted ester cyclase